MCKLQSSLAPGLQRKCFWAMYEMASRVQAATRRPSAAIEGDIFDEDARVAAVWVTHLNAWRITLTPPTLLDARAILMLASGDEKAKAVHAALDAQMDVVRWPAQFLRAAGDRVEWIIDAAAARWLGATPA